MTKFITTVAIAALVSVTLIGSASAGPGNGGSGIKPAGQQSGFQLPQMGGSLPGKGKTGGAGGPAVSPGDAFYPDLGSVGDPKQYCLDQGGTPLRRFDGLDFFWACRI